MIVNLGRYRLRRYDSRNWVLDEWRKPKKITQLAFANPTEATVRVEYDYMSGYEPNDTWGFRRVPEMKLPKEE